MKLSKFWGPVDSQKDLLKENAELKELVSQAADELNKTHALMLDYMERIDSILDFTKKISDGTE